MCERDGIKLFCLGLNHYIWYRVWNGTFMECVNGYYRILIMKSLIDRTPPPPPQHRHTHWQNESIWSSHLRIAKSSLCDYYVSSERLIHQRHGQVAFKYPSRYSGIKVTDIWSKRGVGSGAVWTSCSQCLADITRSGKKCRLMVNVGNKKLKEHPPNRITIGLWNGYLIVN